MKHKTFLLGMILILASCEAPRDKRTVSGGSTGLNIFSSGNQSGNDKTQEEGNSSEAGDQDTDSSIPNEIKHCSWSLDGVTGYASSHHHFSPNEQDSGNGQYTVCQSQSNEADIYIQMKNPISDSQLCIFPTHHEGGNSIYIGEPRCLRIYENKKIYKVTLMKNRPGGYSQFPITGVMMMKDKAYFYPPPFYQYALSPDAYIFCSQFLDQYQDPSYCTSFKQVNQYVYQQF